MTLLAKPDETILQHTENALKVFKSIKKAYNNVPELCGVDDFWEHLFFSIFFHDFGKGATGFQEMLKEAVDNLQGKQTLPEIDPEIRISIDAYIPEDYCPDQHLRLGLYKKLFSATTGELSAITDELKDLYGPLPGPVKSLLLISEVRDVMKRKRFKKLDINDEMLRLYLSRDSIIDLERIIDFVTKRMGRLRPEGMVEIPLKQDDMPGEVREILYSLSE